MNAIHTAPFSATKRILANALVVIAAAALGLGIGWRVRERRTEISEAAELRNREITSIDVTNIHSSDASPSSPSTGRRDDSPLATKLERDLSMSDGVTRWLYWLEAIENAGPSDFPSLIPMAQNNSTITRLLASRWVELDPRHMFDTLVAAPKRHPGLPINRLTEVLFDEWLKRDAAAVIAALSGPEDFGPRRAWRLEVASSLFDTDVERGIKAMSEWQFTSHAPRMKRVAEWAAANPRHAAKFALAHPAGHCSETVMRTIGEVWGKTDPAKALEFGTAVIGELGDALGTATLTEWSSRNLPEAAQWLASADDATRRRFSPTLVEAWAKQDANSALAWCESNLTGRSLAQAVGGVMKGVAQKDVGGAAGYVTTMSPSTARAEAAVAVANQWVPNQWANKSMPEGFVPWLSSLDTESVKRVLRNVQWSWSETDPKGMAAFVAAAGPDRVPEFTYSRVSRALVRSQPHEALAWANQLPEPHRLATGTDTFSEWRQFQPEPAMNWLIDLPSSDPRREPFFWSAVQSLAYDPHGPEQLAALRDNDRAAARAILEGMGLAEDRRAKLFESLAPR